MPIPARREIPDNACRRFRDDVEVWRRFPTPSFPTRRRRERESRDVPVRSDYGTLRGPGQAPGGAFRDDVGVFGSAILDDVGYLVAPPG